MSSTHTSTHVRTPEFPSQGIFSRAVCKCVRGRVLHVTCEGDDEGGVHDCGSYIHMYSRRGHTVDHILRHGACV